MVRQYVGARYVPKFADPTAWASGTSYEAMTIVTYNNSSYTSKMPVPATVGNPADNPDYWALTGNYNAQVEQYRQETETVSNNLTTEIKNRKNADTTLQGQITTEIKNRETADATLQNNIKAEATARQSADNSLSSRISQNDARINNLVGNTGDSNSEIVDARVGANGKTYSSLGESVRTQIGMMDEFSLSQDGFMPIKMINGAGIPLNGAGVGDTLNLTPEQHDGNRYAIVECSRNDEFYIRTTGGINLRPLIFLNDENKILFLSTPNTGVSDYFYVPKSVSKVIINDMEMAHQQFYRPAIPLRATPESKRLYSYNGYEELDMNRGELIPNPNIQIGDVANLTPAIGDNIYVYSACESLIVDCKQGDFFYVNNAGGSDKHPLFVFVDSENKVIYKHVYTYSGSMPVPTKAVKAIINNNVSFDKSTSKIYYYDSARYDMIPSSMFEVSHIGSISDFPNPTVGDYMYHSGDDIFKRVVSIADGQTKVKNVLYPQNGPVIYKNNIVRISNGGMLKLLAKTDTKSAIYGECVKLNENVVINIKNNVGGTADTEEKIVTELQSCKINNIDEYDAIYFVYLHGGYSPLAYCFLDENNVIIKKSDQNAIIKDTYMEVPQKSKSVIINHTHVNEPFEAYLIKNKSEFILNIIDSKVQKEIENVNAQTNIIEQNNTDVQNNDAVQLKHLISYIGEDKFTDRPLTVADPVGYVSWPMISYVGSAIVCCYAKGMSHVDPQSGTYYRTSIDGIVWSVEKKLLDDPGVRQNVTGKGYDINGNAVFWVRIGDNFDLYKFDGKTFSIVSSGNTVGGFAHFGDIIKVNNNELICFWNDYATNRSYGIARSKDNGVTWNITKFDAETNNSEVPTEIQGVYIGDGKILAIGRKDVSGSTAAQMQFQSDDNGSTWTKKYTNITDIYASTTSMIINNDTNEIYLYYYNRSNGKLLARHTKVSEVWNNPTNWPESEVIATGRVGQDAGNANAVKFNGKHYISYYSGDDKNTGVYVVIRNE